MPRLSKISKVITRISNCKMSVVVLFPSDKPVLTKNVYNNELSLNIDVVSFIKIDLPYNENQSNTSIILNQYYKHIFISLLKKMCLLLQKKDVFYIDSETGEMNVYTNKNSDGNSNWLIKSTIGRNLIALHPIVVHLEEENNDTEGIRIMVNSFDMFVDMTYENTIILIEILKDINIPLLSQLMIDSAMPSFHNISDNKRIAEDSSKLDLLSESTSFQRRMEMMNDNKDSSGAMGKAVEEFRQKIERRFRTDGEKRIQTPGISGDEDN